MPDSTHNRVLRRDPRGLLMSVAGAAILAAAATGLPAQGGSPAPVAPTAVLIGTVYDSVHSAPLRRAAVLVEGTSRVTFTDDEGRYRLDSIAPGAHRIRVDHTILDSLGLQMVTNSFELADKAERIVDLAIPSAETLVTVSCPAAQRALGPSAIIGRLLDADSDAPVDSGKVSFAWSEISISARLRRVPRVRMVSTTKDGVFRICGLPSQVEGTLQADKKGITTSEVRLTFEGQPLVIQGLRIGNAQTVARAAPDTAAKTTRDAAAEPRYSAPNVQRGQAVLTGRVVGASGQPMAGARVDVEGTNSHSLTRANGEFTLTELPSGTQTAVARQLGYAPVYKAVELSTRGPATVTITMSKPAQVLAPVVVKAQEEDGLNKLGFTQRKRAGNGRFVTGEEVMRRAPNVLTDVFRTIPGLRVTPGGSYGNEYVVEDARSTGLGGCVKYMVDGAPWEAIYPGDLDRLIPPWEIGGIEVYHASSAPIQFTTAGNSSCAVIVIWSKHRVESATLRKR